MSAKKRSKRTRRGGRVEIQGKPARPAAQADVVPRPYGQPPNRAARRAKPGAAVLGPPRPVTRLVDGGIGYYADLVRADDCFRAAIATATQIPVEQVPDLRLQERLDAGDDPDEISQESWQRIARWVERRGLQLVLHKTVPADRERWIGVCVELEQVDEPYPFSNHCLIMSHNTIIFDPAVSVIAPRGTRVRTWQPSDVTYGLSFDPLVKE